ncbi:Appr-1-p processing [Ascosphaera apis ARSEF 7405]|uniref:Appr-1-p processing n=1 Tax=Ascosphaera apis ARSEF 7405 TaxID=392613 RepID=A0A166PIQ7_9EURO|nr:Appr-1-p processing [Ascosphaera apis ARSEF 7405]
MTFSATTTSSSNERPANQEYPDQQQQHEAEDISSDDDSDVEGAADEEDDDPNMEPISTSNIIEGGRRTRGKRIDFSQAAANEKENEDDEEDDEEFSSQGHLHQRDPRSSSSLFDGYDRSASSRSPAAAAAAAPRRDNLRPAAGTSAGPGYGYGYGGGGGGGYGFAAYPNSAEAGFKPVSLSGDTSGYRSATPNSKGQYSDAVLSSLESQNDEDIEGITARVKMLKNVTLAIGDEIRDSTALAEKMNETFDTTRVKLRGTMNRMLRMAEKTGEKQSRQSNHGHSSHIHDEQPDWVLKVDIWHQLEILRQLLSTRPAVPELPSTIFQLVDEVVQYDNSHKLLTSSHNVLPSLTVKHNENEASKVTRISVWKGDITTLTDVTAIVNAANSKLLGCFNPQHKCIDNIIHSAAGPRLRKACHDLIAELGPAYEEPEGLARVTPGYNLPAEYVLHTVGPQLTGNKLPGENERESLARCYRSCLEATESLPALEDGRKPNVDKAIAWLQDADYLLITAGAGLSAATGLDYTSKDLFKERFPACLRLGLQQLYDVIGFNGWPSIEHKWGYLYKHLHMVATWPTSKLYENLLRFTTERFMNKSDTGEVEYRYFIRTSNADGFFAKNGFPADRISTPQGQYKYLQCINKCRPGESVFPSQPYIEAALDYIDDSTQMLTDPSKLPTCQYCGAEMTICVRGGNYFDQSFFKPQEKAYGCFVNEVVRQMQSSKPRKAVILELGVGLNTPPVIRWPNEELTSHGFRLIRAGVDAAAYVPWELEEGGVAVGINGDLSVILDLILPK